MNKINEILTEWTYQLESGYPKKDEDYIVLQNILQESTDFDQSKIHRIVDRARGLQEEEADLFSNPEMYKIRNNTLLSYILSVSILILIIYIGYTILF